MQTRSQRIAPRQRLVALAAQHVDALGRVDLQRPAHAFQIALERGMAGMARLDLIDAGRAQAGQQRRPFGVQRGQFALQRGQVLPPGFDAQPAHAGQFQARRRRQQQLPVDLQFAAVQQRPRARLQSVRQPRGHGLQLGAQAGPLAFDPAQFLQIGVRHFDANHLGLERRSLGNQFIRRFSAPSRRSVSASSWRNCCSRSRRSACACAAVKASRARRRRRVARRAVARAPAAPRLAQALGGRLRLLFQRPQFGFILLVAPDLILQQAQVAGGLRQLAAQAFQRLALAPGAARRVRASAARASSAFQGSACCACPCFWRKAASRSTSASNCALAQKRHRAPTARAPTPHRHP